MSTFKIEDWAGNILNYKGLFERPCFAVAMSFNSFDDAWVWIYDQLDGMSDDEFDDECGEYYVLEEEKGN